MITKIVFKLVTASHGVKLTIALAALEIINNYEIIVK